MRRVACAAVFLVVCPIGLAQVHFGHRTTLAAGTASPCKPLAPAVARDEMPTVNWPVTSKSSEAKTFFNQGITEYYNFNYEEAMRNFRKALALDDTMAMAAWGIALAAGPNINLGMDLDCRVLAVEQSMGAVRLVAQYGATSTEKGLINALALRYAGPLTETVAYGVAMRNVWAATKAASPKGPDAANVGALYAESLLEMRPWGLYDAAYRPALDTDTINTVLKEAIAAEATAIGANHFYIHAIEASAVPRCGLESADLLQTWTKSTKAPLQAPGHLVHMPSHIYLRLGDYPRAIKSNTDAVNADRAQYEDACSDSPKTPNTCPTLYYGHYLSHNLFFRAVAATFTGQSKQALDWSRDTCAHAKRFVSTEPGLQHYMTAPVMTLVMNREWKTILDEDDAPRRLDDNDCSMEKFPDAHILAAMWHWARGMAYAARGMSDAAKESDLTNASIEYYRMAAEMALIPHSGPTGWGNNSAATVLAVGQSTLQAHYTWAGGQCVIGTCYLDGRTTPCPKCEPVSCDGKRCPQSLEQAIEHLKLAVTHEDALVYDEPPQWFPPTREALGGAYLRAAQIYANDDQKKRAMFDLAEKAFDEELRNHPGSGRALYGKMRAIAGRGEDSAKAQKDFCNAWGDADYTMSEEELWPAGKGLNLKDYPVTCTTPKQVIPPDPGPLPPDCLCKAQTCPVKQN